MINVLTDLTLLAVFIVGITATVGVISSAIGLKLGGKSADTNLQQSMKTQTGWKSVGGRK